MPTDPSDGTSPPAAPTNRARHSTAETYQRLVDVEVKSLLARMTELTANVNSVFGEIGALMLQTEELLGRLETLSTGLSFHRGEVADLKKQLVQHTRDLVEVAARITEIERRIDLWQV